MTGRGTRAAIGRTGRPASAWGSLLVLAKAPFPGRSKTRLAPAVGPSGAAALAAAALQDTLDAVASCPAGRRVLVLDGDLGASPAAVAVPDGIDVLPQARGTHAERIAAALAACDAPAVLIGMDTPQVTHGLLAQALAAVALTGARRCRSGDGVAGAAGDGRPRACLGPAADGGWWALGLSEPARHARAALTDVPMSTPSTGSRQRARLTGLGLAVTGLPVLRDVDTPADARAVARAAPATRFARTWHDLHATRSPRA